MAMEASVKLLRQCVVAQVVQYGVPVRCILGVRETRQNECRQERDNENDDHDLEKGKPAGRPHESDRANARCSEPSSIPNEPFRHDSVGLEGREDLKGRAFSPREREDSCDGRRSIR